MKVSMMKQLSPEWWEARRGIPTASAFDRILTKIAPAGGRANWRCGVFYNHGMTLHGTPSDRNSLPVGVPLLCCLGDRGPAAQVSAVAASGPRRAGQLAGAAVRLAALLAHPRGKRHGRR